MSNEQGKQPEMKPLRVNVRQISKELDSTEDEGAEGQYAVIFRTDVRGMSDEKRASMALDIFHAHQSIEHLDDFEIAVIDEDGNVVAQDLIHEDYSASDDGDVEKISDAPVQAGKLPKSKTVYCIERKAFGVGGVDWFYDANDRAASPGGDQDIWFDIDVPVGASKDEITNLADQAMWGKSYLGNDPECRAVGRKLPEAPVSVMLHVPVTTRADVSPEQIRAAVQSLIDIGLTDAASTLKDGEGDLDAAQLATDLNIGTPVLADAKVPESNDAEVRRLRAALTEVQQCLDGLGGEITRDRVIGDNVDYVARARYVAEVALRDRDEFPEQQESQRSSPGMSM